MEIAARFEHKILIDDARRAELLARFADRFRPDTAGSADGRYPVVSLYCDTPDRRCHWEAWRGVPSRRKLRVRIYGTRDGSIPSATFVEVSSIVGTTMTGIYDAIVEQQTTRMLVGGLVRV
ncbi:MAG: VTC domain-containing protein, partial [Verrucomicrobia bacterium]|nr:VTC domain-containing protein [Verrucomicrobiota bacterium]